MIPEFSLFLIDEFCMLANRRLSWLWKDENFNISKYEIDNDINPNGEYKDTANIFKESEELNRLSDKCLKAISNHFDYHREFDKELKNIEFRLNKLSMINEKSKFFHDLFFKHVAPKKGSNQLSGLSAFGMYLLNIMFNSLALQKEIEQRFKIYRNDVKSKKITDAKERYFYFKKMRFDHFPEFLNLKKETQYKIISKIFDVNERTAQGFLNNESKYSDLVSKEKIDEINETLEKLGIK